MQSDPKMKSTYNKMAIGFFVVIALLLIAKQIFTLGESVSLKPGNTNCSNNTCEYQYSLINNTQSKQTGQVYIYFRDVAGIGSVNTSTTDAEFTTVPFDLAANEMKPFTGSHTTERSHVHFALSIE